MAEGGEVGDALARVMAGGGTVRAVAVSANRLANALIRTHDASPLAAVALSRVTIGALLLGSTLKGRQQVGMQINGDGPLREVYALADAKGRVRATLSDAHATLPEPGRVRLSEGFGAGRLTVTRKTDEDEPAYRGVVPLVSGEVAEDLAHYYLTSEQVRTAVVIGERLTPEGLVGAGGYLVQALPGAPPEFLEALETRIQRFPPLADLFEEGWTPEAVLGALLEDAVPLESFPVRLHCPCERERFARVLVSLGEEELTRLAAEQTLTEVDCHFCRTRYTFDQEQMSALIYGARLHDARLARMRGEQN